jgi:release factor glutamine methyltransferase
MFSRVIGTDLSADALEVARTNAARMVSGTCPIVWRQGTLLAPLAGERVDVIVANPPYVAATEWAALDRGVRDFEPRLALVSAEDGLAHTRWLLEAAPAVLAPGGLVALEIDARRAEATLRIAQRGGWHSPAVRDDAFGRPRYLLATREQS